MVPELGEGTGQVQGWLMSAEEDPRLMLGVRCSMLLAADLTSLCIRKTLEVIVSSVTFISVSPWPHLQADSHGL